MTHLPALAGALALGLAALLSGLATPRWHTEAIRADQLLRQRAGAAATTWPPAAVLPADQRLARALPPASQLPQRISALVDLAQQHGVQLDSVRQSAPLRLGQGAATLSAERVPLRLAGSAAYSAWRRFAADALQQDDALVLADLRLSRNGPTDRVLAGQLQWALLQRLANAEDLAQPAAPSLPAAPATPPVQPLLPTRPADWPAPPATALAAWQGPAAPPAPTQAARPALAAASAAAPVFPYRWIGQLDDGGTPQVLLASAQRSVAVHLGTTLDGRWRLLTGPGGVLQAQPLPDGALQVVPGAPPAALP